MKKQQLHLRAQASRGHASQSKITETVIKSQGAPARSYNAEKRFQNLCRLFLLDAPEDTNKIVSIIESILEVQQDIFGIDILK